MEHLAEKGHHVYEFLLNFCYKSQMDRTQKRRSMKEADHIFCSEPTETLKLEHVPVASDHIPVVADFLCPYARETEKRTLVPDPRIYKEIYEELLRLDEVTV